MNPFFSFLVFQIVLRKKKRNWQEKGYSRYKIALLSKEMIVVIQRFLKDIPLISAGALAAAFGLKAFLLSNHFIDGGVTGISLLVSAISGMPLYLLVMIINTPFIVLGYRIMGREFAFKTIFAIFLLAVFLAFIHFKTITNDKLLVAVFGGFFLGAGIGFTIRGGAVIDGTEILAVYLSRKLNTTIGTIVILINILIFSASAYLLSIETALYSMITYMAASKTLDFIVDGIDEYIGVTIVSFYSDEIREAIINKLGRGVTVYKGKRGYGKMNESKEVDIIYTVVTRMELNKLKTEIEKIEPKAFIVMNSVKDAKGGVIKKKPLR